MPLQQLYLMMTGRGRMQQKEAAVTLDRSVWPNPNVGGSGDRALRRVSVEFGELRGCTIRQRRQALLRVREHGLDRDQYRRDSARRLRAARFIDAEPRGCSGSLS